MLWRAGRASGQLKHVVFRLPSLFPLCTDSLRHIRFNAIGLKARKRQIHTAERRNISPTINTSVSPPTKQNLDLDNLVHQLVRRVKDKEWKMRKLRESGVHLLETAVYQQLTLLSIDNCSPETAYRLVKTFLDLGVVLPLEFYEQVANYLGERNHWIQVDTLVRLAEQHCQRVSCSLLNWKLAAHVRLKRFALLNTILADFQRIKLIPNRRTYHLLLQGHIVNRDLTRARQCVSRMGAAGFPVDATTHLALIEIYHFLGPDAIVEIKALEALLGLGQASDTALAAALLRLRVDADDPRGILHVFRLVNWTLDSNSSIEPDGDAISSSSSTAAPSILPNSDAFRTIIKHFSNHSNISAAQQMFALQEKLRPVGDVAAAMVTAHLAAGDIDGAVAIVAHICAPFLPNRTNPFVQFGYHDGIPAPAINEFTPSPSLFNALLRHILTAYGLEGAQSYLRIMHICGVKPDGQTLQFTLLYLREISLHPGFRPRPRQLVHVLRSLSHWSTPTVQHLNAILHTALQLESDRVKPSGWKASAASLSRNQRSAPLRKPTSAFTSIQQLHELFEALPAATLSPGLNQVLEQFRLHGIRPDRATYAMLIRHEAVTRQDVVRAQAIYDSMTSCGIVPARYHVTALMHGYANLGDVANTRRVMKAAAVDYSVQLNVIMYTILVGAYAQIRRPDLASAVFTEMLEASIKPDIASVDALVRAYFLVKAYKQAKHVVLALWPLVAPVDEPLNDLSLGALMYKLRDIQRTERRRTRHQSSDLLSWRSVRERLDSIVRDWSLPIVPSKAGQKGGTSHRVDQI